MDNIDGRGTENPPWIRAAILVGLALVEAALLYKLIAGPVLTDAAELIGAICLLAILLLLVGALSGLRSLSFGKEGFKAEIEHLAERTAMLEREVADLTLSSMGEDAYFNLRKLATGDFGPYELQEHVGLYTELYHLRNLGFIALRKHRPEHIRSIRDIPPAESQLSAYVEVTDVGRRYLALRRRRDARGEVTD